MEKEVKFESKNQGLKHVAFVRVPMIRALVCVSNLYEYAKQNSGPLRSAVGTVEGAVATVISPIYDKYKDIPDHLLVFLDSKVDEALHKFDEHVPPAGKQMVHTAAQKAGKFVDEAHTNGGRSALHYAASEYKHFVLVSSTKLWVKLNHCSAFHSTAEVFIPTALNLSDKYNCLVKDMSGKGYPVFGYLPLIPVGELSEAVKQAKANDTAMDKEHVDAPRKQDSDSDSDSGSGSGSGSDSESGWGVFLLFWLSHEIKILMTLILLISQMIHIC